MKYEKGIREKNSSEGISPGAKIFLGVLAAVLVVGLGVFAASLQVKKQQYDKAVEKKVEKLNQQATASQTKRTVTWEGAEYKYNTNLTNVLFLGVDKDAEVELQDTPGTAGQADCIMLFSMNEETKECQVLQISRDTMTDVDLYDTSGNLFTSVKAQLATQYAYGNGEKSSCWAMDKTVSELLFDLPIDAYISLSIDSIGKMNDALGGVTLTIPEDYTDIDPAFKKGASVKMTGEQAEKYVRYRDTETTGSNEGRMRRQVDFITALLTTVQNATGREDSYFERYSSYLKPYMVTDMDAREIDAFASYGFDPESVWYLPGEMKEGKEHDEFYVDENALQREIMEKFYIPEEDA